MRAVAGSGRLALAVALLATTVAAARAFAQDAPPAAEPRAAPAAQAQPPARPLLYFFEHVALREAAFQYDQDMQALIANPRQAGGPVSRLFAKAAMRATGLPNLSAETAFGDMRLFMQQITFDTIEHGGYTVHVMGMPPPEYSPEAYFVAIVYKDGEPLSEGAPAPSTRYITFEKTSVEGSVFALGEWSVDGRHTTHGFGDREPTIGDFVANVYAVLEIDGQ